MHAGSAARHRPPRSATRRGLTRVFSTAPSPATQHLHDDHSRQSTASAQHLAYGGLPAIEACKFGDRECSLTCTACAEAIDHETESGQFRIATPATGGAIWRLPHVRT